MISRMMMTVATIPRAIDRIIAVGEMFCRPLAVVSSVDGTVIIESWLKV